MCIRDRNSQYPNIENIKEIVLAMILVSRLKGSVFVCEENLEVAKSNLLQECEMGKEKAVLVSFSISPFSSGSVDKLITKCSLF